MTDAELQGITAQALNMAKRDIQRGKFNFLLAAYHAGEGLHRMTKIEATVVERLGEEWLNRGGTKDFGFLLIQFAVAMKPPDAVVWVTAANMFKPTPALAELSIEEQKRLLDSTHDRHHQAVKEGLLTLADVLTAVGQTAESVCHYVLEKNADQPTVQFFPQADFAGRMKMYGHDPLTLLTELESYRKRGVQ
jgi:hypothetical protein